MSNRSDDFLKKMIGSYIRARRETLGLSQKDVADALGLRQQYIARLEKGTYYRHLDRVSPFLGLTGLIWAADWPIMAVLEPGDPLPPQDVG